MLSELGMLSRHTIQIQPNLPLERTLQQEYSCGWEILQKMAATGCHFCFKSPRLEHEPAAFWVPIRNVMLPNFGGIVSSVESTLTRPSADADSNELTGMLKSLEATFRRKRGASSAKGYRPAAYLTEGTASSPNTHPRQPEPSSRKI